ncbi:MAG: nucleotide exchange factor GrpE [Dethiobacter sp.]|jgi:molecular chaperone GrpE|nr:nucleotide exchange factor GrpE [Dethiobacter sp.]
MSEYEKKEYEAEVEDTSGSAHSAQGQDATDPAVELIRLREENSQLFSRLQRLHADFDNYRKRMRTERQEWSNQALCELIKELLPVIDNLERASQAEGTTEVLLAGVGLVYKQLYSVLSKQGLSVIEACGLEFDPNYHHAIMQVESGEPENTVVEELQKGYRFNDRVLRASMVKVAK